MDNATKRGLLVIWLACRRSNQEHSSVIDFLIRRCSAASWGSANSERMNIKTATAEMIKPMIREGLGILSTHAILEMFSKYPLS